ncbi:MAG: hypothetical protein ACR2PY_06245 [Salinispira sp.]
MDLSTMTLCELKPEDIQNNMDQLFIIVKKPEFICLTCARSAADKKNLCNSSAIA